MKRDKTFFINPNFFRRNTEAEISGNAVTLKGENGAYTLAVWTDGQYAHSISVAVPISREIFTALIEENFG